MAIGTDEDSGMSTAAFQAVYDGEALRDHLIDVEHLAPAMLALGELVREANYRLNGEKSKVKLLVRANHETQCFDINFQVLLSIWGTLKGLIQDTDIKDAKELLEWLGITGSPIGMGLLAFMKLRRGRKVTEIKEIKDEDKRGMISVQFEGDGNHVEIHQNIYQLSENSKIQKSVAGAFAPLHSEGIERLQFRTPAGEQATYDRDDVQDIEESCNIEVPEEEYPPQDIEAHLEVYGPVLDLEADAWRFDYGGEHIRADITDTNIAESAIQRGGVSVGDTYKVRLEIVEYLTPTQQRRKRYKILEVLDFYPGGRQSSLLDAIDREEKNGEG